MPILTNTLWGHGSATSILEETVGSTKYTAYSNIAGASPSAPVWAIQREWLVSGATMRTEWAGSTYHPNKRWDLRASYFESIPPTSSTYSTQFNGTTQYLDVLDNDLTARLGTDYAVSFWMKGNIFNLVANKAIAVYRSTSSGTPMWWYIRTQITGSNITLTALVRDNSANLVTINSGTILANGEWYHVTLSRSGNTCTLYLDGVSQGSGTAVFGTITANKIAVCADFSAVPTPSGFFQGRIEDFCVWDTFLTPAEIVEIYNGGYRLDPKMTSKAANITALYYMGDGDTLPVITDQSGRGNHATAIGLAPASFVADVPNG